MFQHLEQDSVPASDAGREIRIPLGSPFSWRLRIEGEPALLEDIIMKLFKITLLAGLLALLTGCATSQGDAAISPAQDAADKQRLEEEAHIQ